ncbi:MAG TPA: DEAD/DEAH box helicase [bacterium]|nr:DEAD/DEAH box helicase [bacterium]HQG45589.1 DEAD/DEAH box helicase [bacterium]HQI48864.1 DEAD/DEAH box helicase [bacterium]HQJ64757.1 DEAD/DEAH box helicase [bacterium]
MNMEQLIDVLKRDEAFLQQVTLWREIEPQPAVFAPFPCALDPRLVAALQRHGIRQLYSHQAQALAEILAGRNTVVVTPTASGKTLCYNIPVLQAVLKTREARALYLFPTKALSQDQVAELHALIALLSPEIDFDIRSYTFDGDTPVTARKAIRTSGHIVVTNPDMLHSGVLPHHTLWVKLFENLRYIVIDEIHNYRGVFGSHVANVLRRLKRICAFYGTQPQFICCSATIANPSDFAHHLTGEAMALVDENGAPRGRKHFIFYNPPIVNRELGIRRSYIQETEKIAGKFLCHGIQTIVFARSRMRVEILLTYLKDFMRHIKKPAELVRGYRGGYLPSERREIERGLRRGEILGVVSTNALELGIDIGQLQVCIMAGYPGTIASTWQQAGRAGRRNDAAIAILVASSSPLDQFIISHPEYLFEKSPEAGIINPDNLIILLSHIKCAAFELPFSFNERFGRRWDGEEGVDSTQEILAYLEENRVVHKAAERWHWMAEVYPAEAISLRSAAEENVVIIDRTMPQERVIGEIDLFAAPLMVHDEAIYLHGSQQYHVDHFDWERRKAYVREVAVDHYTDAQLKSDLRVLDISEEQSIGEAMAGYGEVSVTSVATMYKKIKFGTHENIGWGKISLPESTMHTMAFWYAFPEHIHEELGIPQQEFSDGLKAAANVLGNIAPLFIMGDPRDIAVLPMMRSPLWHKPSLFIWERYPGGVGHSGKLFQIYREVVRAGIELVQHCGCENGCPSCSGPALEVGETGKHHALQVLEVMLH